MSNTKNKNIKYKKSKRLNKKNNTKNTKKQKKTKYIQKGGKTILYKEALNILNDNKNEEDITIHDYSLSSDQIIKIANALKQNTTVKYLYIFFNIGSGDNKILSKFADALKTNTFLQRLRINQFNIQKQLLTSKEIYDIFDDTFNINTTLQYLQINGLIDTDKAKLLHRSFKPPLYTIVISNNNSEIIPFIKEVITNEQKDKKNKIEFNYDKLVIELCESQINFELLMKQNYNEGLRQFKLCSDPSYVNNTKTNKIITVNLHGAIKSNMFKLPSNINIVFLSPIKYLFCSNLDRVKTYLSNKIKEYLANPSCYNKDTNSKIFNQSVIYYGGQYCINLDLSRDSITTNPTETTKGLFLYKNKNFDTEFNINNTNTLNITYSNLLSTLLQDISNKDYNTDYNPSVQYTLFFQSCRDISKLDYKNLNNNKLTFYEQTLQAVNFKIQFDILGKHTYTDNSKAEYLKCKYPKNTKITLHSDDDINNIHHVQEPRKNTNVNLNEISSRINVEINDDTLIYYDLSDKDKSISIKEIKNLISNTITRLEKFNKIHIFFDSYFNCWTDKDKPILYYNPCFKKKNDLLIYIFNNNFQLAFEFLIYMILKTNIIIKPYSDKFTIFFNEFINSNSKKLDTTLDLSSLDLKTYDLDNLQYLVNNESTDYRINELILDNNDLSNTHTFNITETNQRFYKDIVSLSLAKTQIKIDTLKNNIKHLPKLKKLELTQTTDNKDDYSNKTLFVF